MTWQLVLLAIFVAAVAALVAIIWRGLVQNHRPKTH